MYYVLIMKLGKLGAEMFGLGDFWLETKIIILDSQEHLTDFHGSIFFLKFSFQNSQIKKLRFSKPRKFQGLNLGSAGLIDAKGIGGLNLYGCEAVRHKLKNRQKMHFLCF